MTPGFFFGVHSRYAVSTDPEHLIARTGNYETLLAHNGPRHTVVAGLFMGASVDGEPDLNGLPSARANGDDPHRGDRTSRTDPR